MNDLLKSIKKRADELEAETAENLCAMIRIPSFSTKEKEVVQWIAGKMAEVGMDRVDVDGLGNVIGRIGTGERCLAFDAHIDTVYPGDLGQWTNDPFAGKIAQGKVWGRGASDQKGGMAAMFTAAQIIKEFDLAQNWSFLFTGTVMEEDCDGLCWRYIIEHGKIRPELVVITEPTSLNIYRGHRGRMEIRVKAHGISCHGSAPGRGENAIYKMARVALAVEQLNERLRNDAFLGKGTITVSEFKSGSPSQCAVADYAHIYLDRRLTIGETAESATREIAQAAEKAGCPDVEIEIPTYEEKSYTGLVYPMEKYYPTWALAADSPWVELAKRVYLGVLGREPFVDKWTFSTNGVAIAGIHGIPCIGLGPGHEAEAHAANESCPVKHLSEAAAFYAGLAAKVQDKC